MSKFSLPAERILQEGRTYVDDQLQSVKLHTVKGLSLGTSTVLGILLIMGIAGALVLVLSFACVMWLGELLGSYALSGFIVAAFLLVALVVVILLRKKLFRNSFVPLYSDIIMPSTPESTLEGLAKAIEESDDKVREQEALMKVYLSQAQEYYTPSHMLNEGLRRAGESAGRGAGSLVSWIPTVAGLFLRHRRKKKAKR